MIVDLKEVLDKKKAFLAKKVGETPTRVRLSQKDFLDAVIDGVNDVCKDGYRFGGFIYSHISLDGGYLNFIEDSENWIYSYDTLDKLLSALEIKEVNAVLDEYDDIHCCVIYQGVILDPVYYLGQRLSEWEKEQAKQEALTPEADKSPKKKKSTKAKK